MEFIKSLWLDHQTQILIWLGLGLATGVVAKYIMPGKDKGGLITTTLIGICGSFLGGFIGNYLGLSTSSFAQGSINILTLLTAIAGALVLLLFLRVFRLLI